MADPSAHPALIAFDGSPDALGAIRRAAALLAGRPVLVLHVWRTPTPSADLLREHARAGMTFDDVLAALQELGEAEAREIAAAGVAAAREAGLDAESLTARNDGAPWFEIVRVADEREAAVIVVGARGLTRGRAPLGGVSDAVVHVAGRPVLVVHGEGAGGEGPVVLGYDGSAGARAAIALGGMLLGGRPAIVVHVGEDAEALAEEGAGHARDAGFDAAPHPAPAGSPLRAPARDAWRGITEVADGLDAAAIVVGARGQSAVRRLVLGSASMGVLHHAGRPVLVCPEG
jgi:nucleotide-binding universal stress UspA family protein